VIIRGRIIDYGYKDIGTINPLYRGIVPVLIDSVKDLLFGTASSYDYEADINDAKIENMLIGAAMGAAIGNNIVSGSTSTSSSISSGLIARRTTISHRSHDDHMAEGAAIGAGAGWMASQHPKKAKDQLLFRSGSTLRTQQPVMYSGQIVQRSNIHQRVILPTTRPIQK